jgi:hypothetical protein
MGLRLGLKRLKGIFLGGFDHGVAL